MPTHRIHNFSAGPAILPVEVLEEAQRDLVALPGVGMSVMEISHRSKPFDEIIQTAEANLRKLASVPDGYKAVPPGRRQPAVLRCADESAHCRCDG
jgi:phosphoserine aminotransferase